MKICMLTIENLNLKVDNQKLKLKYARLSFTFIKSLLNKVETVEAKPDPNQNTSRSTNIAEVNNSVNIFLFYLKTSRQILLYGKQKVKGTLGKCKFSEMHLRRGVRSDAQLKPTETRFQKCSQSGKNGSKLELLTP